MKHYAYMDENPQLLSERSMAWFMRVRSRRLLRQYERNYPGELAVRFAEIHLGVLK